MEKMIRTGLIGLGGRGLGLLYGVLFHMTNVDVVAVCDLYEDRTEKAAKAIKFRKGKSPLTFQDYNALLSCGLDAVIVASSWESHIDIAIAAMEKGIPVGLEVGGAYSVEDCWRLVDTYEKTKTPCMLLENCCYGKYEMMVLNMAETGVLGEIVHCSGGYQHDLREEIAFGKENRHYRLNNYLNRNCENYPTHELGPIAMVLKINRGNLMTKLVSVATKSAGLHEYIIHKKTDDEELKNAVFKQGDIVTTLITCKNGETITLTLDTTLPRHYSRGFTVRGTKGMYQEEGNILFLDGMRHDKPSHLWNNAKRYERKYRHPVWKAFLKSGVRGGHGGMDWLVLKAFFDSVANGTDTPISVYDAAAWMSVTALSEISIKENRSVDIPDFMRGKTIENKF